MRSMTNTVKSTQKWVSKSNFITNLVRQIATMSALLHYQERITLHVRKNPYFGKAYASLWTPVSAMSNESRIMFSSLTSWSSKMRMAIIAAAPEKLTIMNVADHKKVASFCNTTFATFQTLTSGHGGVHEQHLVLGDVLREAQIVQLRFHTLLVGLDENLAHFAVSDY